MIASTKGQ